MGNNKSKNNYKNRTNKNQNNIKHQNNTKKQVVDEKNVATVEENDKDIFTDNVEQDEGLFEYLESIDDGIDVETDKEADIKKENKKDSKKDNKKDNKKTGKKSNNKKDSECMKEEGVRDVVLECRQRLREKSKKEVPETTVLEDIQKNIKLWFTLAVLVLVLIIALIVTNLDGCGNNDNKTPETTKPSEELSTEEKTTEPEDESLKPEADDSEIAVLVANFLQARSIDVSMEKVSEYLDNTDNYSLDKYEKLKKYIEGFQNIECYKLDTNVENMSIVIVTYGYKFFNIETAAPGLETLYVVKNGDTYLIHNITKQETIDTYISSEVDKEMINQFVAEINKSLENALQTDEELKNVIDVMRSEISE